MSDEMVSQEVNDDSESTDKSVYEDDAQRRFDERFGSLMNGFGKTCEEQKVDIAIAIAKHPEEQHPIVFIRGDVLSAATLLADVLRQIKAQIDTSLRIT